MNPSQLRIKRMQEAHDALLKEGNELRAKADHTEAEAERYAEIPALIKAQKDGIDLEKSISQALDEGHRYMNSPLVTSLASASFTNPDEAYAAIKKKVAMRGRTRYFSLIEGLNREEAGSMAYGMGRWLFATQGHKPSLQYCADHGIPVIKASAEFLASGGQSEGDAERGAALVPPEFENALILLREKFGVFRTRARISPMSRETKTRPRRKGGLTAYAVAGGQAAAESQAQYDNVMLTAKKIMVSGRYESELSEDAIMDIGDTLSGEIAYAFAKFEDGCGFIGDGTSAYAGIVGITQALITAYGVAEGAGQRLAAGHLFGQFTLGDFQAVTGKLPLYAETPGVAWYCHKVFWETIMVPLALAAGGVPAAEIVSGIRRQFLGYPVILSQIMPKTDVNSQVPIVFGALELSTDFGDRRATTIAISDQFHFDTDELAIRGTERFDINNHDVGNVTDAGPMISLISAAS